MVRSGDGLKVVWTLGSGIAPQTVVRQFEQSLILMLHYKARCHGSDRIGDGGEIQRDEPIRKKVER